MPSSECTGQGLLREDVLTVEHRACRARSRPGAGDPGAGGRPCSGEAAGQTSAAGKQGPGTHVLGATGLRLPAPGGGTGLGKLSQPGGASTPRAPSSASARP